MIFRTRVPIRVKLILTFLLLVTAVVGAITFSTAGLFQEDKRAYVNGLTSMVALATAEETRFVLSGYRERLRLYARLMLDQDRTATELEELSQILFDEFEELIAVAIENEYEEPIAVYNVSLLDGFGLTRDDLQEFDQAHTLPLERLATGQPHVRNSSLAAELPSFTLTFELERDAELEQHAELETTLVRATLKSDRLIALTSRFSAYDQFLADSEGNVLAHSDLSRVTARGPVDLQSELEFVKDRFNAGLTAEYQQDGKQVIAGLASVEFGDVVVVVEIPTSAAQLAARDLVKRLLTLAAFMLAIALALAILWAHRITGPIERLSDATRTIAGGDFNVEVRVDSRDEIGDLASSFNKMAGELKTRDTELNEAHQQLVHSEKMAAFGQLGAGIAHEVKNPLTGILACAQLAIEELDSDSPTRQDLHLIEKETLRCKSIIENLLKFAKQDKAEFTPIEINSVIKDTVAIVNHQLEVNEVHVECELQPDLPLVLGNANQLQQVFMNLMINAQQAMEGQSGALRITSSTVHGGWVELCFSDNGPGIPEEIQHKLFEPFFTTKATGEGTGLGLSVSYGIINDHQGGISVESEVGHGSTFRISLQPYTKPGVPEQRAQPSEALLTER